MRLRTILSRIYKMRRGCPPCLSGQIIGKNETKYFYSVFAGPRGPLLRPDRLVHRWLSWRHLWTYSILADPVYGGQAAAIPRLADQPRAGTRVLGHDKST